MKNIPAGLLLLSLFLLPIAGNCQSSNLLITEFLTINNTGLTDEDGDREDWIEIHNAGTEAADLDGYYLTDNAANLTKWRFPQILLPPDGYLIVFASDKNRAVAGAEPHTNFQITSNGEYLGLIEPDGVTAVHDYSPKFPMQFPDVSYGLVNGVEDFMVTPTPGAENLEGGINRVAPVRADFERGFYNQSFQVSLQTNTPDSLIRYTLDGQPPTATYGLVYSTPITVNKTTVLRAIASKSGMEPSRVATHSYIFPSLVVNQTYPGGLWPAPGVYGPRNQVMDYDMDRDVTLDPRYSGSMVDSLLSIPTLSLVTHPNNLFHPSTDPAIGGIYTNANQDGGEWERPVSMELIHPDGTPGFQIDAGIRIRGGWSRGGNNPKHAFRFFFRSEYGESRLRYPLFGDEGVSSFDKIDLRCSTDYSWNLGDADGEGYGSLNTQTRDVFARDTQRDMGQPYTRSRQYHLYINGLYWGMYQSQERSEAAFAESYLGGSEEEYDAINRRSHSEGAVDGNLDAWTDLWQKTVSGFETDEAYYAVQGLLPDGAQHPTEPKLLDRDNLVDYMLTIYYTGSFDTPVSWWWSPDNSGVNNIWTLFNRVSPDGFKYFCHDCEHTLLAHLTTYPYFPWSVDRVGPWRHPRLLEFDRANPQTLHQNLLDHPAYRKFFMDKVYDRFHHGGPLTPEAATERFTKRIDEIDLAIIAESARWGDAQQAAHEPPRTKDDDFVPTVNGILNDFFPHRTEVVLNQLKARGWYPPVVPPVLKADGAENRGGHLPTDSLLTLENPNGFGRVFYTLDGTDPWTEPSQRKATTLVREDAEKRVHVPSGPVVDWATPGYDDSTWNDGYIDGVLQFDGVDDSVDFGPTPGSSAALTAAFWVYAQHGDHYVVLDKYPSDQNGRGWKIRLRTSAALQILIRDNLANTNHLVDRAYLPEKWTHIAWTFASGESKVYIDGMLRSSQNQSLVQTIQNDSTPLRMGIASEVETNLRFEGRLNDVRIYDRALSAQEVEDIYDGEDVSPGLTSHWKLDETSGTTVQDGSGNGHDGTASGDPTWRIAGAGGVGFDDGEVFDAAIGTDAEAEMRGTNPSAYLRIPFTVSAEDLADFEFLNLRVKYDAGFVAFLNGQKVAEADAPATPEWNSTAMVEHPDELALVFRNHDLTSSIGALVEGDNLLAIQGLNSASDDEDFLISAELVAWDIHPDAEIHPEAMEATSTVQLTESLRLASRVLDVGEWSPLEKASYAIGPVTESLRITEVHYHPDATAEAEFIELKNIGDETIRLRWVRFTNGIDFTFPSLELAPGEIVVLVGDPVAFESVYGAGLPVVGVYEGRLSNYGERIRIEDSLGAAILDFDFSDGWHPTTDGAGPSLTFRQAGEASPEKWNDEAFWSPSSVIGGTPGEDDEGPFPTETPTVTPTPTMTPTPSETPTSTETPSFSPTPTETLTPTATETETATPTQTEIPTETPTSTVSYDWTGEGDVDAKDLLLILNEPMDSGYFFGFAVHWLHKYPTEAP